MDPSVFADPAKADPDPITEKKRKFTFIEKLTTVAIAIVVVILSFSWFARTLGGDYYYITEYIKAAFGNDALEDACASVMTVKNPAQTLVNRDWFKLQRCLGNRDGFDRQGEIFLGLYDAIWYCLTPFTYLGPLFTFGSLTVMGFVVLPFVFRQIGRFLSFLASSPIQVLVQILTWLIIPLLVIFYIFFPGVIFWSSLILVIVGGFLASSANHAEDPNAWTWTNLFEPFVIIFNALLTVLKYFSTVADSWANLSKCHHVDPCTCPTIHVEESKRLTEELEAAWDEITSLRVLRDQGQQECLALNRTISDLRENESFWRTQGHNAAPEYWDSSPRAAQSPNNPLGPAANLRQAQQNIEHLNIMYTDLVNEKRVEAKNFTNRIKSLQEQLSYAQGDGNATEVREEVDALKAKERHLKKQVNTLNTNLMHATQSLNYERTNHSSSCKNEAACSTKIRELDEQRKTLLKMHEDNDTMVQEAAREFGKSEEEARHYTLKTYLQEITQAMVRQIAAGNLINPSDKPIFNSILSRMDKARITEITEYKNRLEMEVHRLGGDVKLMRLGLDPKRPPPTRELTYETNANTVFDVYQGLFQKITYMSSVLVDAQIQIPIWEPEPPRSDFYNKPSYLAVNWADPRNVKEVKNPRYEDNEVLLQSLLKTEISRLVNRGLALKSYIEQQPHGNDSFWNDRVKNPLRDAEAIFKNALFHILDDARPLEKRYTAIEDTSLIFRAEKRYRLWRAMQQAILALKNAITSFNSPVPNWSVDPAQPAPNFVFRKTFESLATNLMKFEVNTLEHRIDELLLFIEYNKLPGSTYGAPRQSGPPVYQADFDALKAAVTYALLCKDHWADEVSDPSTEKPVRLPLDHPPLIHALLRKTGEVMVPKDIGFAWTLSKDGKPVKISELVEKEQFALCGAYDKEKEKNVQFGEVWKEREWYKENYDRAQQLINHIDKSGKQYNGKTTLWNRVDNPDEKFLRGKKAELFKIVGDLQDWMKTEKLSVPKMIKNGGKMNP